MTLTARLEMLNELSVQGKPQTESVTESLPGWKRLRSWVSEIWFQVLIDDTPTLPFVSVSALFTSHLQYLLEFATSFPFSQRSILQHMRRSKPSCAQQKAAIQANSETMKSDFSEEPGQIA